MGESLAIGVLAATEVAAIAATIVLAHRQARRQRGAGASQTGSNPDR